MQGLLIRLSFFFLNGDETGGRMTSLLAVTWKFPFDEEAFLADLDLDFFFLLGVLFGGPLLPSKGGLLDVGDDGLGLPSRLGVDGAVLTSIGLFTMTD